MINELDRYEGLLATSMFMMPKCTERRRKIYDTILQQGASLHFVPEDVVIRKPSNIEAVEEILSIHDLLAAILFPSTMLSARAEKVADAG
jgi:sporadic carbohydrate cluster protein (TIGR04323 family)